jgi:hypothetical protein
MLMVNLLYVIFYSVLQKEDDVPVNMLKAGSVLKVSATPDILNLSKNWCHIYIFIST